MDDPENAQNTTFSANEAGVGRFAFGKNWSSFARTALRKESVDYAVASLQKLLGRDSLEGLTFLDIGCGSGLFSLAANALGASEVNSFDFDTDSVHTTISVRERMSVAACRWNVLQGSVLDDQFMGSLAEADVVYSWGVLHHTGDMWRAIDNAAKKVKPGGLFAIAIYNNVERQLGGSRMWWRIKRLYNRSPAIVRRLMEWSYVARVFAGQIVRLRTPHRVIEDYASQNPRGMDFWHDVRDWVGGFPYEYATAGEVFRYIHRKHGFLLVYLNTHDGHTCEEFTFQRSSGDAVQSPGRGSL